VESKGNKIGLIISSALLVIPSISSLFGLYWLYFGGRFSYEGWYFIAFSVYFSALFIPSAVYFYLWPKLKLSKRVRLYCSIPFVIMVLFSISLAWVQVGN
jgi:hypothetical protein